MHNTVSSELLMEVEDGAANQRKWNLVVDGGQGNPQNFYIRRLNDAGTGGTVDFAINGSTEDVEISHNLYVSGLINGTVVGNSDARLKENIEPLEDALSILSQLRGISYDWIDPARGQNRQIGVIAQEVEQVLPEIVHTDNKGYKSVEYAKLVAPLIEAIKTLKSQNEALKRENQAMRQTMQEILARLDILVMDS